MTVPHDSNLRWIVTQEGSRRNYSVPAAFCDLGMLRVLCTDIWCRAGPAHSYLKHGPRLARALAGRHHATIPNDRVISFTLGALARKATNFGKRRSGSRELLGHFWCDYGTWFASRSRSYLQRLDMDPGQDLFFGFNTGCLESIQWLRKQKVMCILNQVDPARVEEDLVAAEMECWPEWSASQGRLPERYWDRLKAEWDLATLVAVNSEWTRDALIKQGVAAAKMFVAPLGVDLKSAFRMLARPTSSGPLKVLWLGTVNLRKGIPYFIEAARLLINTRVEFMIAGELEIRREIVSTFPPNVRVQGPLPRIEVPNVLVKSDVLVLPTLSDGFGVTQLEAMSQGVPVIATPNCGRVVTNGVDGFIIPPRDSQALADVLANLASHRGLLREMSRQAQISVRRFDLPANIRPILAAVSGGREMAITTS